MCFREQSFLRCVFCSYFLPAHGLSAYSLDIAFAEQNILIFMKNSSPGISLMDGAFGVTSEKLSPHPNRRGFLYVVF